MVGFEVLKEVVSQSGNWSPIVGQFTENYLGEIKGISPAGLDRIVKESAEILGNCAPPATISYSEAGLVVGFVQSGKTMSFTTIAALARDNGYGIVVVLTGITNLLKSQSIERLVDDLGLENYPREWKIYENPGAKVINASNMERAELDSRLRAWERFHYEGEGRKPSILVTVLKSTIRINNLATLFSTLDLVNVPTLIVDDESDQATPNTKSAKNLKNGTEDESATYSAIGNLRSKLPKHTYLQYTATPQANLLAAKSDLLSPKFARVISAGDGYTGGDFFFGDSKDDYIRIIPPEDTIKPKDLPDEPPESLLTALRSFWLGAAIAISEDHRSGTKPAIRSMMIQVSQMTMPQSVFRVWSQKLQLLWKEILRNKEHPLYEDVKTDFKATYDDLEKTYEGIPPFEVLVSELADVLEDTKIVEVNSTADAVKSVEWFHSQFWILVGGMKLDRGFTVKGITTTYMPRAAADNADTLQQRARFFGYHGAYAGLCRIFLSNDTLAAFKKYLEHETLLRKSLQDNAGKPLSEWKRAFVLNRAIRRATRSSVVGVSLRRNRLTDSWVQPNKLYESEDAVIFNRALFSNFEEWLKKQKTESAHPASWKDNRKNSRPHELFEGISSQAVIELLLSMKFVDPKDSDKILALCSAIQINQIGGKPELFDVVLINALDTSNQDGRNFDQDKGIENIFIGRNPASARSNLGELIYVGDREIHTARPTIHLRLVKVVGLDPVSTHSTVAPWVAIKLTKSFENDFLIEMDD